MKTTLNKIKSFGPCEGGWKKLLNYLGKTEADDQELTVRTILDSNGLQDAIWSLRAVKGHDREIRLFAADCAESVLRLFENKYPNDDIPRKAIQAARDYANGLIDVAAMDAARDAARAAARAAAWAAAWAATRDAARAAAWAAAMDAAWGTEREKQKELLLKYI